MNRPVLCVAATMLLLGWTFGAARADVTLNFTQANNFGANNSDLPATVTFHVAGNTLTITVNNEAPAAQIAGLFFNAANATGFGPTTTTSNPVQSPALASTILGPGQQADGFGNFNWELSFGSSFNTRLQPGGIATVTANFTGTITDADLSHQITGGGGFGPFAGALDWKPLTGATGFGGGNVGTPPPVPEPSTAVLALSGLGTAGLIALRRRRRAKDTA